MPKDKVTRPEPSRMKDHSTIKTILEKGAWGYRGNDAKEVLEAITSKPEKIKESDLPEKKDPNVREPGLSQRARGWNAYRNALIELLKRKGVL